jgi:hypothetical protein
MRDMNIYIDGRVPVCREDLSALKAEGGGTILGNALTEDLETIWARGQDLYLKQCGRTYPGICAGCDEYYTFNF